MNIIFKTSPFTFVFKYLFPVFMLGGFVFGIFMFSMDAEPETQAFTKGMVVMTIWTGIFLVQMPFRLKNLEVSESGIWIKDFGKKTFVAFKDIHWVTYFDLAGPWSVTLKYFDTETGMDKKICYMPVQQDQRPFIGDKMTTFIRDKIAELNPNYKKEDQPSTIKNFFRTLLLGLPFLALFFYFMWDQLPNFFWFLR